jgi:hypothetical protein
MRVDACQLTEQCRAGPDGKRTSRRGARTTHKIPESLRAFCRIVSLTAANTSRMFDVSVACVKLQCVRLELECRYIQITHCG